MKELFLTVAEMSLSAGVVILAVLAARFLLRPAPRKWSYLLWAVVAFRLLCPVGPESPLSIFGLGERLDPPPAATQPVQRPQTPERPELVRPSVHPVRPEPVPAEPKGPAPAVPVGKDAVKPDALTILTALWLTGAAGLLLWAGVSEVRLRHTLRTATRWEGNVWQSEHVRSPFVLGLFRPRIYLPYHMEEGTRACVLAHERFHLRRGDHLARHLAFVLLAVHWFNPLVWLSFWLMGRDMELSCDEGVLRTTDTTPTAYSEALLTFAAARPRPLAVPLAFGESGVRVRIKNALGWKRPRPLVTALAVLLCGLVLTACATDPAQPKPTEPQPGPTPVPSAAPDPEGPALTYFKPVMGFKDVFVRETQEGGLFFRRYYGEERGREVLLAESFGPDAASPDFARDLDGDGEKELICPITYGDGMQTVWVYRRTPERGVERGWVMWNALGGELPDGLTMKRTVESVEPGKEKPFRLDCYLLDGRVKTLFCGQECLEYDTWEPSAMSRLREVLFNGGPFTLAGTGEETGLEDFLHNWEATGWDRTAVRDLDEDGVCEVIVPVDFPNGDTIVYLILHTLGDRVYGYEKPYRGFMDLRTDGSYDWSNGAFHNGTSRIFSFGPQGIEEKELASLLGEGSEAGCLLNGERVTESEYTDWLNGREAELVEFLPRDYLRENVEHFIFAPGTMSTPADWETVERVYHYNGREYRADRLSPATIQWLELTEAERSFISYFPPEFIRDLTVRPAEGEEQMLSLEDADYLLSLLTEDRWEGGLSQCAWDYELTLDELNVTYHSECGTVNDRARDAHLTLENTEREAVNALLESCREG